eukprot:jgi/Psemu1/59362/gm1.59362_g
MPTPPDNAHKHEDLNKTFTHDLEYTDGLFITDDDAEGPKTLAPDPVPMLREIIRLRNKHSMDKTGELAIENRHRDILIEIRATHWGFKTDWDAINFAEVYDTNIYSFPKKSNTCEATTVADKTPNTSRARFAKLPERKHIKPQAVLPNTANLGSLQPVGPIANPPCIKAPRYIWTWTYFQKVNRSPSTASALAPSPFNVTLPRVLLSNVGTSLHLVNQLTFDGPLILNPSLQLRLFKAIPEDTILASAIPTFAKHRPYSSHFQCVLYSNPNQTVFRITKQPDAHLHEDLVVSLTKRHRDALKIKLFIIIDIVTSPSFSLLFLRCFFDRPPILPTSSEFFAHQLDVFDAFQFYDLTVFD